MKNTSMGLVKVELYDIVELKKEHPCNARSKLFQVVRLGADLKIQCQGCGNVIIIDRITFNKRYKKTISQNKAVTFEQ